MEVQQQQGAGRGWTLFAYVLHILEVLEPLELKSRHVGQVKNKVNTILIKGQVESDGQIFDRS
jgi:hypothetical protein